MTITRVGTLPASSLNVGLAVLPVGIAIEIAALNEQISKLGGAVTSQLDLAASFPPDIAGYTATFGAQLSPASLIAAFAPTTWLAMNADIGANIAADLAFVEGQLTAVAEITASLRSGITAPGIAGWSYAGKANGFGTSLERQTQGGFAGVDPARSVGAVILATEDFAGWQSFSAGIDTGGSASEDLGDRPQTSRLLYHGTRSGGDWSPVLKAGFAPIELLEAKLEGAKAGLEAQAQVSLGVDLPDVTAIVDAGLSVDLGAALGNIAGVQLDLGAQIDGLNVRIDALNEIILDINAALSAGGIVMWSYEGPAGQLGSSLASETQSGIPGSNGGPDGPAYGLVLAGASPEAWASFGNIFKTS